MSKTFEFEQTSIPSQYSMNLKDNFGMLWVDTRTADLCRAMFAAIADTLKLHQTKDTERVGMIMKDEKGNFKLGAISFTRSLKKAPKKIPETGICR